MADQEQRGTSGVSLVAVLLAVGAIVYVVGGTDGDGSATDLTRLSASTTRAEIPDAPSDPRPQATTDGTVVHPRSPVAVRRTPGGQAFAKVPPEQFGPTWLPVIDETSSWVQVLLPSRPNGSVGWVRASAVERRHTSYVVRVHTGSRTVELVRDGEQLGSWPVAVGRPETPTPTGRTFVLGQIDDPDQSYSPVILPLGAHSATLQTYGGGPGTVAFHGWPDASVFGRAVSHGCVRVPADALRALREVPLGSLVVIDAS